jgi:hypothetical protein
MNYHFYFCNLTHFYLFLFITFRIYFKEIKVKNLFHNNPIGFFLIHKYQLLTNLLLNLFNHFQTKQVRNNVKMTYDLLYLIIIII